MDEDTSRIIKDLSLFEVLPVPRSKGSGENQVSSVLANHSVSWVGGRGGHPSSNTGLQGLTVIPTNNSQVNVSILAGSINNNAGKVPNSAGLGTSSGSVLSKLEKLSISTQSAAQAAEYGSPRNYTIPSPPPPPLPPLSDDPIYENLSSLNTNPPQYPPPPPPPYEGYHNKIIGGYGMTSSVGSSSSYQYVPSVANSVGSSRSSPSPYSGSIVLNKSLYTPSTIGNGSDGPIYENLDTIQYGITTNSSTGHYGTSNVMNVTGTGGLNSNGSNRACPQVPVKKPPSGSIRDVAAVAYSEAVSSKSHLYAEIPSPNQFKPIHSQHSNGTPSPYAVGNIGLSSDKNSQPPGSGPGNSKKTAGGLFKNPKKLLPSITLHKPNVSQLTSF